MKCSLISIVQGLGAEFPLETCGNLEIQITDIQEITEDTLPLRTDTLYIINQNHLLNYHGPTAQGPVLCISHTRWNLSHSQPSFPVFIMVLCPEPGKVYSALSRHLYQEGVRASQMPEVSGAFLRCRSLDALVETGFSYLGNPFAVHDSKGKLLTYSRQAGLRDTAWQTDAFLETFCNFHSVDNANSMDQSRRDQMPVMLHPESGPPQMRMALSSRGQTLGYLTVIALFHPFTRSDLQIVELLGCFIALDLLRQSSITRISVSDAGRLKNFLESGEVTIPEVPQWLEQQHCTPGAHFYLLLLNTAPHRQTPFWDLDELLAQLDRLFPDGISTRLESGVVLLIQSTVPILHHDGVVALMDHLAAGLVLGISMPFTNLAESGHAALRQAKNAMELGTVLHPEQRCYSYETYTIYAGLRAASARVNLQELLPLGLQTLIEADTSGETLHTLEVYLSTGGKKARAAELLFIHLNTLKYRLGQIAQKLEVDLDDPKTLFSLEYALHIIRYLRCFGDHPNKI